MKATLINGRCQHSFVLILLEISARVRAWTILAFGFMILALSFSAAFAAAPLDESNNTGWFVRLGGRTLTGVKAQFRDTRPALPADPQYFDDGFVKADISGGADTWNWGYSAGGQISGNQLTLHRTDGAPRVGDRPVPEGNSLYGGELVAGFELTRFDIGRKEARFGVELGYGFISSFSARDTASMASRATRTSSTFNLGGIIPPVVTANASYAGTFEGPGPMIGLNPVASARVEDDGVSRFDASVASDLHTLRLGPWVEFPISGRFTLGLSAGYCAIYADTDFRFTDSVIYPAGVIPNSTVTGRAQRGEWSPGGYAQLRLGYDVSSHVSMFVGGDFQHNGSASFREAGREVKLKFGATFGGTVGLMYKF